MLAIYKNKHPLLTQTMLVNCYVEDVMQPPVSILYYVRNAQCKVPHISVAFRIQFGYILKYQIVLN